MTQARWAADQPPAGLRLPAAAASVGQARAFVRAELARLGGDDVAQERGVLLASELVTNAVLHARTDVVLTVAGTVGRPAGFVVAVADGSVARLRPRRYGADQSTGRGLRLVQSLSAAWGVEPSQDVTASGKRVWFRLPAHVEDVDDHREAALLLDLFDVDTYEDLG